MRGIKNENDQRGLPGQPEADEFQSAVTKRNVLCLTQRIMLCSFNHYFIGNAAVPKHLPSVAKQLTALILVSGFS